MCVRGVGFEVCVSEVCVCEEVWSGVSWYTVTRVGRVLRVLMVLRPQ